MNANNPRHALMIAFALFILLAGCSFPVDRETPTTPSEENTVLVSITPTAAHIASAAPTEIVSMPFVPSPAATITPTIAATPTDNQQNTLVNESTQQPLANVLSTEPNTVPVYAEATPTMTPAQPDSTEPDNIPNDHSSSVETATPGEIQENTPTVEQPTVAPLVVDGVIFPDPEEPWTKLTPTPCFICTLE